MVTESLPTTAASFFQKSAVRLPQVVVPLTIKRLESPAHDERHDRNHVRQPLRPAATDMLNSIVEISPTDIVKRRATAWPGMAVETVQATRLDRIESRFRASVHLLAVYERGVRHDGATLIEGLPKSRLRDFSRKLLFVPAGHEYRDLQEPRVLT